MASGQREADRRGSVVAAECGSQPGVKSGVANFALRGGKVRGIGCVRGIICVLPILQVAGLAIGREPVKNAGRRLLVAVFAKHRGVCSQQGETILMILRLLNRNVPSLNRMALRTIGSHLPPVHVRVTIRAIFSDIREDRLRVAKNAVHFLVQAAQGILRLVVVKFRNGANFLPASGSVAVLARNS